MKCVINLIIVIDVKTNAKPKAKGTEYSISIFPDALSAIEINK